MFSGNLVALVTPMQADGAVDFSAWEALIDWQLAAGTDGLVVLGSTGEAATLNPAEQDQLLRSAVKRVGGKVPVIAGAGTQATATTIERVQWVKDCGADAALVVVPFYNKPTQEGLVAHYTAICDAVALPVILYNHPGRTATDLLPETAARLAAHDRIVGIKEAVPDPDRIQALVQIPDLAVFSGDDGSCCASILMGAEGVISVASNVAPHWMHRMVHAALAGQQDAASAQKAQDINNQMGDLFDVLGICTNPIPVKWALSTMGRIGAGIRLPLTVLSTSMQASVRDALLALDLMEK